MLHLIASEKQRYIPRHTDIRSVHRNLCPLMEDMETLVRINYSGRYGQLYTETNPIQRKIMEAFGLALPT